MGGKQMEGDNQERRQHAKEARDAGQQPSEVGATLGSSKQPNRSTGGETHQEKLDLKSEGKHESVRQDQNLARPHNRDDAEGHDTHPRLED